MLKIRLKKVGRKHQPSYRLVVMSNTMRRDGRPIEEIGYYNAITKIHKIDIEKVLDWNKKGAQSTETVKNLLKKLKK
jgi:small subunit ribosomal protein S16